MKDNKNITMHIAMFNRVTEFLLDPDNIVITQTIEAFFDATNDLAAQSTNLQALLDRHAAIITGIAAQKQDARITLADISHPIMAATKSYALSINDLILARQMDFSLSELSNMRFADLTSTINQAIGIVNPLVPSLSSYNVTNAMLINWQNQFAVYTATLNGPQLAIAQRKSLGEMIDNNMRQTIEFVSGQMDSLAFNFIEAQPLFYANYKNNRKLIHTSTKSISPALRLFVLNQQGLPVTDGIVYIIGTDKSESLNQRGHSLIEHIPAGSHSFTLTTPFGSTTYGPFNFLEGKILTLHVQIGTETEKKPTVTITDDVEETASENK